MRYMEALDNSELSFLIVQEEKERRQYYKVFRFLMFLSFILPFAGSWYKAYDGAPNAFSALKFFTSTAVLLSISAGGTWMSFRINLRKIQWDIKQRTKTIETTQITQKRYMPHNDTYHFYLSSLTKLSIEVTPEDYHRLAEGDEVSIEYTTHACFYLGYF
ncbi:MAG: hypothetical protein H0X33_11620 [Taibaiella sp.]|nr:hypothetical protein [Taibaiella sp.]